MQAAIKRIVVVGGGTAGWMTASVLARALSASACRITVIESPDFNTVGVDETTTPHFMQLLRFLSINPTDFIRHTQATYKLGTKFIDWRERGHRYWHPFGTFGEALNLRPFYHAWQRCMAEGTPLCFNDYSLCAALGDANKFRFPDHTSPGPAAGLRYALHFDASLVVRYLQAYAERLGVDCQCTTVVGVTQRADGFIDELKCADGASFQADLFIDCTGFRGVLIEQTLQAGYISWQDMLPCNRAVAVQSELVGARPPYTEATALEAGWRWRIPLQHRVGNGYVYSSAHIGDVQAEEKLLQSIPGKPLKEPWLLRFVPGRRKVFWSRNCVAIGLACGFLEPLESTSIRLIASSVFKLLEFFPTTEFCQANIDAYNNELIDEFERIRDFIGLHYCLTNRSDAAIWNDCRTMSLPDSLRQRIELYRETGRIRQQQGDLFTELSWFYVLDGMGVRPQCYDPLMDAIPSAQLRDIMATLAREVSRCAAAAPSHDSFFQSTPAYDIA